MEPLTRVSGVQAAALCDYDGILIETQAAVGRVNLDQLCAWSAEMGRYAGLTSTGWNGGGLQTGVFEGSMGSLLLSDVTKGYLVVVSDPTTNSGILRLELDRAAQRMRTILSGQEPRAAG